MPYEEKERKVSLKEANKEENKNEKIMLKRKIAKGIENEYDWLAERGGERSDLKSLEENGKRRRKKTC